LKKLVTGGSGVSKLLEQTVRRGANDNQLFRFLGEENLLNGVTYTGFCAGFHFRLFDDLRAMLHLHAHSRAFIFVNRMAHAETAQAPGLVRR
jgi:hypothetical protein